MSDLSTRVAQLCTRTLTTLQSHYSCIGLGRGEVDLLLVQLESDLSTLCNTRVDEARAAENALRHHVHQSNAEIDRMRGQLGLPAIVDDHRSSAGSLQELKAARETEIHALQDQKGLHVAALRGDLAKLQGEWYKKLEIAPSEVAPEFLQTIDENSLDLSQARIKAVENELARMEKLMETRNVQITGLISEMSASWSRLGLTNSDVSGPYDSMLFATPGSTAPASSHTLEPTTTVIEALENRKAELLHLESRRRGEIADKRNLIATIHKKIQATAETIQKHEAACAFHAASNSPLSTNVLKFYAAEADRLETLKQQKMQSLVFEVRLKLNEVYTALHKTQSEMCEFKPLQSTVYTDAVLEAHEAELARATAFLATLTPIFKEIAKWREMKEELEKFEQSSADPTRFSQRNAHLILKQEEKLRKKRDTVFPALESKLAEVLLQWECDHPNEPPVKINGEPVLEQVRDNIRTREEKNAGKKVRPTIDTGKAAATPLKARPHSAAMATPAKAALNTSITAAPTPLTQAAGMSSEKPAVQVAHTPRLVQATPIKKSLLSTLQSQVATPVASSQSHSHAPVTPSAPVTPLVRPGSASRIPSFGTTTSLLHSTAQKTPLAPTRLALGEITRSNVQQTIIVEESPVKPQPVKKETRVEPIPIATAKVDSEPIAASLADSFFMERFYAMFSESAGEAAKLELFSGPCGFAGNPTPAERVALLQARAKLYLEIGAPEERQLAEEDQIQAHILSEKIKAHTPDNAVEA